MTTHYQKIQALGNRMAENLTIMGVPSQFDEGGLTLADKILEISSGITTGLLLYGDKKVAQSGDTVNLSMMVLEDGEFQPNTNVILHETILDKTYSTYSSISKRIGDNWVIEGPFENIISSSDTSGTTITAWGNGMLTVSVGGATVYHDSEAGSISKISYINKILSYNNKTVDLTEYNASFNILSNVNAGRIIVKTAYVLTTDTHGLATHAYTCSGSGLREFYATSGTFVSETYELIDAMMYDKSTYDKFTAPSGMSISFADNRRTWEIDTYGGSWLYSYLSDPNISTTQVYGRYSVPTPFCLEFELIEATDIFIVTDAPDQTNPWTNITYPVGKYQIIMREDSYQMNLNGNMRYNGDYSTSISSFRVGFVLKFASSKLVLENLRIYHV